VFYEASYSTVTFILCFGKREEGLQPIMRGRMFWTLVKIRATFKGGKGALIRLLPGEKKGSSTIIGEKIYSGEKSEYLADCGRESCARREEGGERGNFFVNKSRGKKSMGQHRSMLGGRGHRSSMGVTGRETVGLRKTVCGKKRAL